MGNKKRITVCVSRFLTTFGMTAKQKEREKGLSQKNADNTDDADLRRYDFFDMSNYKHFSICENQRYPRHPRSKMPFKTSPSFSRAVQVIVRLGSLTMSNAVRFLSEAEGRHLLKPLQINHFTFHK